jgi:hypothetical protein
MKFSRTLLPLALVFAARLFAWADEPALQPQRAVLVLHNRHVLEGNVTPAGDYYLVSLGKTGQVRLAAKEVEMVCRDLQEAYQRKSEKIAGKPASAHLDLADWCIKQSLFDGARREIALVRQLEPQHPQIASLEKRIEFATTTAKPVVRSIPSTATVSAEQLERTMKEQPPGTVEHFTAVVQPILMDRCGAAKCHGSGATTSFQLLQPIPGKIASRRFTQRNLFAALGAVDKELPEQSPLLEMARKPHGFTKAAPFKTDEDRQYREIAKWIHSLRIVPPQAPPATVSPAALGTLRPQMGDNGSPAAWIGPADESASTGGDSAAAAPLTAGRDPFDPEVFNRRFHGAP